VSLIAPAAVAEGVTRTLGASPPRLSGNACVSIKVRERTKAMGFCNRYVSDAATQDFFGLSNGVATGAAADVAEALQLISSFDAETVHVERVSARVAVRRGALLAQLRKATLPRRVSINEKVRVTLRIEGTGGEIERRSFRMRIPADLRPGTRRLKFVGTGPDEGGGGGFFGLSTRASTSPTAALAARRAPSRKERALERLATRVSKIHRNDGVSLQVGRDKPVPVFRDPELRIAGSSSVRVEVRRPRERRN
jgi:hypothetical protein